MHEIIIEKLETNTPKLQYEYFNSYSAVMVSRLAIHLELSIYITNKLSFNLLSIAIPEGIILNSYIVYTEHIYDGFCLSVFENPYNWSFITNLVL